jgi:hypothetical protein
MKGLIAKRKGIKSRDSSLSRLSVSTPSDEAAVKSSKKDSVIARKTVKSVETKSQPTRKVKLVTTDFCLKQRCFEQAWPAIRK